MLGVASAAMVRPEDVLPHRPPFPLLVDEVTELDPG